MSYVMGMETNKLKDFSVQIDNIRLTQSQIVSFKMQYSIDRLRTNAILTFRDETALVQDIPIRGGNTVKALMTDFDGNKSEEEFIVISVSYSRDKNGSLVTVLELLDVLSINALKLYPQKSFLLANMTSIIDNDKTLKPFLNKKIKDFSNQEYKHNNFVIPLNKSFNAVIEYLVKNNNYLFFQTRTHYKIKSYKELFKQSPSESKYYFRTDNQHYRRNILEYNVTMGDTIDTIILQPDIRSHSYNIMNKGYNFIEMDKNKIIDTYYSEYNKPDYSNNANTGRKFQYRSHDTINNFVNYIYSNNSSDNIIVEMLVPGQFSTNVGDIVELDLISTKDETSPEPNINGKFLVKEIIDIIQVPEYLQKIILIRPNYFE